MSSYLEFKSECSTEIATMGEDRLLGSKSVEWMVLASKYKYSYHFEWLGRPVIQFPQDIVALQEIIWNAKPDLVIETGIAHGGSLVLSASILALLDLFDTEAGIIGQPKRKVLGIDIDIRDHNRKAVEGHPLSSRIEMIEGSSTESSVLNQIRSIASTYKRVMVILDSSHSHDHVLKELELYSSLVTTGQYLVVFDTVVELFPEGTFSNRDWDKGNNPMTAVFEFMKNDTSFEIDHEIENKLLITVAPKGFLKKIRSAT